MEISFGVKWQWPKVETHVHLLQCLTMAGGVPPFAGMILWRAVG